MGNGQKSLLPLKHFAASKAICVRPFLTQAYLLTGWCRTLRRFFSKRVSRGRTVWPPIFGSVETSVFLSRVASAVIDGVSRELHA